MFRITFIAMIVYPLIGFSDEPCHKLRQEITSKIRSVYCAAGCAKHLSNCERQFAKYARAVSPQDLRCFPDINQQLFQLYFYKSKQSNGRFNGYSVAYGSLLEGKNAPNYLRKIESDIAKNRQKVCTQTIQSTSQFPVRDQLKK